MISPQTYLQTINSDTAEGILLIDKPIGITSHDVVDWARRVTRVRKIGHSGTLDPLATGLLQVLIGRKYTKLQPTFLHNDKSYEVEFLLGAESETLDVLDTEYTQQIRALPRSWKSITQRNLIVKNSISHYEKKAFTQWDAISQITEAQILEVIQSFVGTYEQQVPLFSAVKVKGKKLYQVGRSGQEVHEEIPKKKVTLHSIELSDFLQNKKKNICSITLQVNCGSGTYMRALVRDIAAELGTQAVVTKLRRTSIGQTHVDNAVVCPLL